MKDKNGLLYSVLLAIMSIIMWSTPCSAGLIAAVPGDVQVSGYAITFTDPVAAVLGHVQVSGYTVTFTDASTPPGAGITVNWGDGSISPGTAGDRFEHIYISADTYYINHTVSFENRVDNEFLRVVVPFLTPPPSKIGTFRNGAWYLDADGSGTWDSGDRTITSFGMAGDVPITGDWSGDGSYKVGIFRNGVWYLDYNGNGKWDGCGTTPATDRCYNFGFMADIPITGDWNGDGFSKIGVFRKGMWYLDYNGNGKWDGCGDTPTTDRCYNFGLTTDIPVAGDWNNDGQTEIGIFRNGSWYLDYKGNGGWDGCGITTATDRCLSFGASGDIPVVGDWNGDGFTEVGTKRGVSWYLDYSGNAVWSGCGLTPATDRCYNFGLASDKPLSGIW